MCLGGQDFGSPRAGVLGGCKPPRVGPGNRIPVFRKNRESFYLLQLHSDSSVLRPLSPLHKGRHLVPLGTATYTTSVREGQGSLEVTVRL